MLREIKPGRANGYEKSTLDCKWKQKLTKTNLEQSNARTHEKQPKSSQNTQPNFNNVLH